MDDLKKNAADTAYNILLPQLSLIETAIYISTIIIILIALITYLTIKNKTTSVVYASIGVFLILIQAIWYNIKYKPMSLFNF